MLSLIIPALVVALVVIVGLAVALRARSRVLATSGALTSTGVFAFLTWAGWEFGPFAWSLLAVTVFNALLTVAVATTPRRVPVRYPDAVEHRAGMSGRTVTVERLTSFVPGVDAVPFACGRLAVVQRADGLFVTVRAVARPEESAAAMETLARAVAGREDVEFVGGVR